MPKTWDRFAIRVEMMDGAGRTFSPAPIWVISDHPGPGHTIEWQSPLLWVQAKSGRTWREAAANARRALLKEYRGRAKTVTVRPAQFFTNEVHV